MILFYVTRESETLRRVSVDIMKETQIKVVFLNQENFIKSGLFYSENVSNQIIGYIQTPEMLEPIAINDLKICFMAHYPVVYGEWISYKNSFDKLYAQQEWNASIVATFLTQPQIKYINPFWPKYDLNSELEQFIILQKFGISTVEILLTNNSQKALEKYNMWDRSVLFKSVRSGYDTSAIMEISDLARMDKLNLSPVIFQKQLAGKEILVCLMGKEILANKVEYINKLPAYKPVQLPNDLTKSIIQISEYLNTPWLQLNFLYQKEENNYFAYGVNIYPDFDMLYNAFGETFLKLLKTYLIEEYCK